MLADVKRYLVVIILAISEHHSIWHLVLVGNVANKRNLGGKNGCVFKSEMFNEN